MRNVAVYCEKFSGFQLRFPVPIRRSKGFPPFLFLLLLIGTTQNQIFFIESLDFENPQNTILGEQETAFGRTFPVITKKGKVQPQNTTSFSQVSVFLFPDCGYP